MRTIDADVLKRAIVEEGQRSKRYKIGEFWELNGDEIWQVIDAQPTIALEREKAKKEKKSKVIEEVPSTEAKTKCIAQIKVDTEELIRRIKEEYDITDGWIPCSKQLPKPEKKTYWVCTDSGYQCQCRWTNVNHFWTDLTADWHWHIMDVPQHTEVVAWKSLPKPWEGIEEDN